MEQNIKTKKNRGRSLLLKLIFGITVFWNVAAAIIFIVFIINNSEKIKMIAFQYKANPDSIILQAIGAFLLLILIKISGAILMFFNKKWGYIQYALINLLLLFVSGFLIYQGASSSIIYVLWFTTLLMLVLYPIAVFKKRWE